MCIPWFTEGDSNLLFARGNRDADTIFFSSAPERWGVRTVLITGATSGIGAATARRLGGQGWRVLVHGRDCERGEAVAANVSEAGGEGVFFRADFTDLGAVRDLADEAQAYDPAVLVNNAGLSRGERNTAELAGRTVEETLIVNHLAPYLLTHELLETLCGADNPRVVVTASGVHSRAADPLADLSMADYDPLEAYARSKLANVAFVIELAERLADAETDFTANALHPGFVPGSRLFRESPVYVRITTRLAAFFPFVGSSVERAADSIVHLSAAEETADVSGAYFSGTDRDSPAEQARDPEFRHRLWTESADLVGVAPDWP